MVPKKRKSYTREFKIETVKLVTEGGASANQVADDMGTGFYFSVARAQRFTRCGMCQ